MLQGDFACDLLRAAKEEGLHCCVETSGFGAPSVVERLHPLVDLWLYDYKETNSRLHVKFTRVGNGLILTNLRWLYGRKAKILLRCPMIPGHNARKEHLDGIVTLARQMPGMQGVEILPYFDLWRAKLARFGLTSRLPESVTPPDRATVKSWEDYLGARGVRVVS